MRRYFADRETAWQAFAVRLSHDGPQALATYRQKNAEADDDARAREATAALVRPRPSSIGPLASSGPCIGRVRTQRAVA